MNDSINEIWRDIEGYEGKYAVSNMGRVKSLANDKSKKEKILRQYTNGNGYLLVGLYKDGIRKFFQVHRLVANAFIENPNNLPCVNHKDENPLKNVVDNLEWCDVKYNLNYGTAQARRVASIDWKELAEKLSRQVYQYSLDGELIKIWQSTNECGRNGYNQGNIAACCRNCYLREGNNVYKNFIWSYSPIN